MMQNQNINNKNLTLQQKQIIMMGGNIKTEQKLSQQEIENIKKDYSRMYYAFTSINWAHGMTLGMAWQKALEQMQSFVAIKSENANHPMTNELIKIHREFHHDMAKRIMTSEYTGDKLSENHKKSFLDYGQKQFKKSKESLDAVYKKYMPTKEITKESKIIKLEIGKQRAQQILHQMLLQQQLDNSRAA